MRLRVVPFCVTTTASRITQSMQKSSAGAAMADHTIALHAEKPAHALAKAHCGLVAVVDIGIQ